MTTPGPALSVGESRLVRNSGPYVTTLIVVLVFLLGYDVRFARFAEWFGHRFPPVCCDVPLSRANKTPTVPAAPSRSYFYSSSYNRSPRCSRCAI